VSAHIYISIVFIRISQSVDDWRDIIDQKRHIVHQKFLSVTAVNNSCSYKMHTARPGLHVTGERDSEDDWQDSIWCGRGEEETQCHIVSSTDWWQL